jgi:hypothetical protein
LKASWATEEADVLFVHIDIQEAPDLSGVVAEVRLQGWELFVERREEFVQIGGGARHRGGASGVTAQGAGNLDSDVHGQVKNKIFNRRERRDRRENL